MEGLTFPVIIELDYAPENAGQAQRICAAIEQVLKNHLANELEGRFGDIGSVIALQPQKGI